jgi:hypothetical protein
MMMQKGAIVLWSARGLYAVLRLSKPKGTPTLQLAPLEGQKAAKVRASDVRLILRPLVSHFEAAAKLTGVRAYDPSVCVPDELPASSAAK